MESELIRQLIEWVNEASPVVWEMARKQAELEREIAWMWFWWWRLGAILFFCLAAVLTGIGIWFGRTDSDTWDALGPPLTLFLVVGIVGSIVAGVQYAMWLRLGNLDYQAIRILSEIVK